MRASLVCRPWCTAVVLALALAAHAPAVLVSQEPTDPRTEDRAVRVLNYNIHHGTGNATGCPPGTTPPPDCDFDLDRTAAAIRAEAPDVVALQEVDRFWNRSGITDQPAVLAEALGMHACYGANLTHGPDRHGAVPHEYGTLILSRHDILECRNTFLPSTRPATDTTPEVRREQRGLLEALVNVRGVPLRVYNTHLEHTGQFTDVRAAQVNRIVELVGAFEEPTILMGDLNARPHAPELQPLLGVFRDAWPEIGDGGPGFTYPAHPVNAPDRRIDYILLSTDVSGESMEVVVNEVTRRASDHYPLLADLSLPGSAVGIRRP